MKQTMIVGFEGVGSPLISLLLAVHFLIAIMLYIMGIMKYIIVRHILLKYRLFLTNFVMKLGWVGLWCFLWWAPSAKRKDHNRVSSGWSSTWFHSNTGLSSTHYEQIPIILGVWPFWLTPFFWSITFWLVYGWIVFHLLKLLCFLHVDMLLQYRPLFQG